MRGKGGAMGPGRAPEPEEDDSARWLGTYGDAVTLLMAFFVMLYAMSEVDAQKFDAFLSGLEGPFGNTSVELLQGGGGIVGPGGSNPEDATQANVMDGEPIELAVPRQGMDAITDAEGTDGTDGEQPGEAQLEDVQAQIGAALDDVGLGAVAEYRSTARGLVVSIASDDVLFALGRTEVSRRGQRILGQVAEVLERFPNEVVVEGHTDDLPIGSVEYSNWNLSTDRAVAVVDVLRDEHDIDPMRLGASGFADQRPVAPNDSPANRARNRRVDVLVIRQGLEERETGPRDE